MHPRVLQQDVGEELLRKLVTSALPRLQPFRDRPVHSVVAALDWDHRLPSRALTLRLHVCYDADSRQRQLTRLGNASAGARLALLMAGRRDEAAARLTPAAERYRDWDSTPDEYASRVRLLVDRTLAGSAR